MESWISNEAVEGRKRLWRLVMEAAPSTDASAARCEGVDEFTEATRLMLET